MIAHRQQQMSATQHQGASFIGRMLTCFGQFAYGFHRRRVQLVEQRMRERILLRLFVGHVVTVGVIILMD